jgi:Gdp/GTP exchange factor required for growth at low temperatures
VDLDFLPDDGSGYSGAQSFGVNSPTSAAQSADMAILQQPLQLAILHHSKPSDVKLMGPFIPSAATLPFHHGPLSRAFVNTIGRLGRWKRVLNSRNSVRTAHAGTVDVSPFHLEPNATGDLLTVRGGVEQYLKLIQTQTPKSPTTGINASPSRPSFPSIPVKEGDVAPPVIDVSPTADRKLAEPLHMVSEEAEEDLDLHTVSVERSVSPASYDSAMSRRQTLDSLTEPGPYQQQPTRPDWQIDVVSIDELELSDMSSFEDQEEPEAPPGLRRVPRKLPLRRDFEFVRRSVSSIAAKTRDSTASMTSSVASSASAEPELGSSIQQWQVNALVDSLSDDDETGDVDVALRHLEGRISHVKQLVKQHKVDNWVKSIRERMVTGDYGDERSRFPVDDDEHTSEYDGRELGTLERDSPTYRRNSKASTASRNEDLVYFNSSTSNSDIPLASQYSSGSRSGPGSPIIVSDAKPAIEDAVPMEILQSRVRSMPSPPVQNFNPLMRSPLRGFGPERLLGPRRSILLGYRASVLAEHFATIERELFMGLKFEELVVDDWMRSVEEANVLDWAQFLKDRARYKAESRSGQKTSALVAFRGRFNLCCNFVISEIVLTPPAERHVVLGKFIRLAWVCHISCHL